MRFVSGKICSEYSIFHLFGDDKREPIGATRARKEFEKCPRFIVKLAIASIFMRKTTTPHIHIEKDGKAAKFNLSPLHVIQNDGFNARDLARLESMVRTHLTLLEDAWHGHFGTNRE